MNYMAGNNKTRVFYESAKLRITPLRKQFPL